jgi:hypothetical protein
MISTLLESLQHNWIAVAGLVGVGLPTSIVKWIDAHERLSDWRQKQRDKRGHRKK